jgi:hypothetical protein
MHLNRVAVSLIDATSGYGMTNVIETCLRAGFIVCSARVIAGTSARENVANVFMLRSSLHTKIDRTLNNAFLAILARKIMSTVFSLRIDRTTKRPVCGVLVTRMATIVELRTAGPNMKGGKPPTVSRQRSRVLKPPRHHIVRREADSVILRSSVIFG